MKLNRMLITVAVFGSMINFKPAFAATLTMNVNGATKSICAYTSIVPDSEGNLTVNCSTSTGGTTAPPTQVPHCSLTSSLPSLTKGASANLMASCSPAATSYVWTNAGIATTNLSTVVVSPGATTTYAVVGVNAAGSGNAATLTLSVSPPTPAPSIPNNCRIVDVTWKSGLDMRPNSATPVQYLPDDQMVAFRMKVPANLSPSAAGTNYSEGASKDMSISTSACDFSPALLTNRCMNKGEPDARVNYNAGEKQRYSCLVPPAGTIIYFNIKNGSSGRVGVPDTCPIGEDCKFRFYW